MPAAASRALALRLALCLLALPALALAIQPVDQLALEIPLGLEDAMLASDYASEIAARAAEQQLQASLGLPWRVTAWNRVTGSAHLAVGPSFAAGAAPADAAALEQLARSVMAAQPALFPVAPGELVLSAAPQARGKWVAHFQQTWQGLEVWQARARLGFADDGRLMFMSADLFAEIALDPEPALDAAAAEAIAAAALPAASALEGAPALLVLPVPRASGGADLHLAWRLRLRTADPLGVWVTHVDAHDGALLWRYNDIHFAYGGTTESSTQPITWCDGEVLAPMPYLSIDVSGLGSTTSNAAGAWSIAGTGLPRTVSCDLQGPYVHVVDNFAGVEAFFSGSASADVPLTVSFTDGNSQADERDVFDSVNDIHDFFQTFAPEFGYANSSINAYVSRSDGYCPGNAWWDGSINFCAGSGNFANTGEIQGVVHHEFGHGVQAAILGWQGNQGLGEGNSDVLANLITQESIIGRGFYTSNCAGGIRNSDNNLAYPGDVVGQPIHYAGQVIAGFHWDAMVALQDAYGVAEGTERAASTWHYGRVLMHPTTQPDQVFATFLADDDDGDLTNGTPDYYAYCGGALNHGFECPPLETGVLIGHAPVQDSEETPLPIGVVATASSTNGAIAAGGVKLHWRHPGEAWQTLTMAPTGIGGSAYGAEIPPQPVGTVQYYLTAEDVTGAMATLPLAGPAAPYDFIIAWRLDSGESETGWATEIAGGSNPAGAWVCVDPVGTIAQPENDHSAQGARCWVTGQHTPGDPAGAGDVDAGWVTLRSPVYDLNGATTVTLRYWKWFSDNMAGADASDFWQAQASNNGGSSWYNLEQNTNATNAWVPITVNLLNLFPVPAQMAFRFQVFDLGADNLVEGGLDDLTLLAIWETTGVGDGLEVTLPPLLDQNVPNPFNPVTEIRFNLAMPGRARLEVLDAQGRRLRTLAAGEFGAGQQVFQWDGRDEAGRPVASGMYFYRLETAAGTQARRMLLIK